jgi:hypothetical protein
MMTTLRVALQGPYSLDRQTISAVITLKSAGAYVLADKWSNDAQYVGRSDFDLANRVAAHIGEYGKFWFAYASSPMAAFLQECYLWHDLHPPANILHPQRPAGTNWRCPVCSVFD